jgi:hypothetical protein
MLMGRAEKIADPGLRRSFLERVEVNREIAQVKGRTSQAPPDVPASGAAFSTRRTPG